MKKYPAYIVVWLDVMRCDAIHVQFLRREVSATLTDTNLIDPTAGMDQSQRTAPISRVVVVGKEDVRFRFGRCEYSLIRKVF